MLGCAPFSSLFRGFLCRPSSPPRLFFFFPQEQNEPTPVGAEGGSSGAAAATADSLPAWTDRRSEPQIASSLGSTATSSVSGAVRGKGKGRGLPASDSSGVAELRGAELVAGGDPAPTEEQLLVEEEQGAEAVAAVAAALRAAGATTAEPSRQRPHASGGGVLAEERPGGGGGAHASSSSPRSGAPGFATPNAAARPAMAPFSVSDTSDLEDVASPIDGPPPRPRGSGSLGQIPVAEGPEGDEEGGVEGVADIVGALGAGKAGEVVGESGAAFEQPAAAAAAGLASPSSPETFFDVHETRGAVAIGEWDGEAGTGAGVGKGGLEEGSARAGAALLDNGGGDDGGVAVQGEGENDDDSLSGDGVGWKRAVGLVTPNGSSGHWGDGGGGAVAADAGDDWGDEWSCRKVKFSRHWV